MVISTYCPSAAITVPFPHSSAPLAGQLNAEIRARKRATEPPRKTHEERLAQLRQLSFAQTTRRTAAPRPHHLPPSPAILTRRDLDRGVLWCVQRGLLPLGVDVSAVVGRGAGLPLLSVEPAGFRPHGEQFVAREVMTRAHGLSTVAARLDEVTAVGATL
eukprot:RCo009077